MNPFSPCEHEWWPLIQILFTDVNPGQHITIEQAKGIPRDDRLELVAKNPVLCAIYYDTRWKEMMLLFKSKDGPFRDNPMIDYFWRTDFQYRGSPHNHMVVWLKDAPKYRHKPERGELDESRDDFAQRLDDFYSNNQRLAEFVDKYVTAWRGIDDTVIYDENQMSKNSKEEDRKKQVYESPIKYQLHQHKKTCFDFKTFKGECLCKYKFPRPFLNETFILEPFKKDDEEYRKKWI